MRTHADIAGSAKGAMQGVVGVQGFCQGDGEGRLGRAREMWTGNASGRWRRPMWRRRSPWRSSRREHCCPVLPVMLSTLPSSSNDAQLVDDDPDSRR